MSGINPIKTGLPVCSAIAPILIFPAIVSIEVAAPTEVRIACDFGIAALGFRLSRSGQRQKGF